MAGKCWLLGVPHILKGISYFERIKSNRLKLNIKQNKYVSLYKCSPKSTIFHNVI